MAFPLLFKDNEKNQEKTENYSDTNDIQGVKCGGYAVLYLHGGSYTSGSLQYARGFGGILADALQCEVLCAAYRLAPEFPFPAAINDAAEAYVRLLERYPADKIAVAGESAGGGLTLALTAKLKKDGLPLPACIVLISPWTDLTFSGASYEKNRDADPTLSEASLRYSATLYRGQYVPTDPYISPVFADMRGFPPALIFAGTEEILMDDAAAAANRMRECGAKAEYQTKEGMWHAYVLYPIPEAKEANEKIVTFIKTNIKEKLADYE
ncbi:Monoterpene epsilon-lactone hydrolase [bioreactor metagenome]|uniref:Monoterpene epsilon-lactone hydrolase n=1 Tax=bioreactor metagenome TaxID=1076179 RepID=A0A645EL83_9ZZZZ